MAAGINKKWPIYESEMHPGGLCSSYYLKKGTPERLRVPPEDEEAYRFEIGGGHWIFGVDKAMTEFLRPFVSLRTYERKAAVYFRKNNLYVPYPIQNNLRFLEPVLVKKILSEISSESKSFRTMKEWLQVYFGLSLCELFFYPFHELYTSGLFKHIAPQDAQKSPIDLPSIVKGAQREAPPAGYNIQFVYPEKGLNTLVERMAEKCAIHYGHKAVRIDTNRHEVIFLNGKIQKYDELISTLPLNQMLDLTGLKIETKTFPHTSVLVLNIGAVKGDYCPDYHWLYNPDARSGFHRVGFYSNVDSSFLPKSVRSTNDRVSLYIERAFPGGDQPTLEEIESYSRKVIQELQEWEYIKEPEVIDPTWINVAYTWAWPDSPWKEEALKELKTFGIHQMGRYGQWHFQGIAESIREGLKAEETVRG